METINSTQSVGIHLGIVLCNFAYGLGVAAIVFGIPAMALWNGRSPVRRPRRRRTTRGAADGPAIIIALIMLGLAGWMAYNVASGGAR